MFAKLRWALQSVPRTPKRGGGLSVWLFRWGQQRFTGPGKSALAIGVSLMVIAAIPGWDGATLPLLLLAIAFFASWLISVPTPKLTANWQFPRSVSVTTPFTVRARVVNQGKRALYDVGVWMFWEESWMKAVGEPPSVAKLDPGESAVLEIPMQALVRGPCALRGPVVFSVEPFGLMRGRDQVDQPTLVLVRPKVFPWQSSGFLTQGTSGQEFSRILLPNLHRSSELLGVREYRDGDELRDVHHKTWARLGKPFTKEYGKERGLGVILIVETGCNQYFERSAVDPMLSLAGSVATWLSERGVLGRFFLNSREYILAPGNAGLEVVLDALADVPHPQWWSWPKPEPWAPEAHAQGPVLAIGCAIGWAQQEASFAGGIQKRIVVFPEGLSEPGIRMDGRLEAIDARSIQ